MAINLRRSLLLSVLFIAALSASAAPSPSPQTAPTESSSPPSPPESSPSSHSPLPRRRRRSSPAPATEPPPELETPPAIETAPAPVPEEASDEQMNNIIDALIGSGDFGNWADLISGAVLPLSATLFAPENDAVHVAGAADSFLLPYHVVPQRLSFQELLLFKTGDRLPTLLPEKSIVITNSSRQNFSIDGSPITLPDLYDTPAYTIHGVGAVLDYSLFGGGADQLDSVPNPRPEDSEVVESPPAKIPADGRVSGPSSSAAPPCLCVEFPVFLTAFCVIFGFKIQRNNFLSVL